MSKYANGAVAQAIAIVALSVGLTLVAGAGSSRCFAGTTAAAVALPDAPSLPDGPAVGAQANAACFARVANGWTFSAVTVGTQFNQTQYLIQPGDTALVSVPGPSTMCIWECIWNGASYDCRWDCGYTICPDGLYRVTQSGPIYDLTSTIVNPGICQSCGVVGTARRTWGQVKQFHR